MVVVVTSSRWSSIEMGDDIGEGDRDRLWTARCCWWFSLLLLSLLFSFRLIQRGDRVADVVARADRPQTGDCCGKRTGDWLVLVLVLLLLSLLFMFMFMLSLLPKLLVDGDDEMATTAAADLPQTGDAWLQLVLLLLLPWSGILRPLLRFPPVGKFATERIVLWVGCLMFGVWRFTSVLCWSSSVAHNSLVTTRVKEAVVVRRIQK
jgi:hypothetical protein